MGIDFCLLKLGSATVRRLFGQGSFVLYRTLQPFVSHWRIFLSWKRNRPEGEIPQRAVTDEMNSEGYTSTSMMSWRTRALLRFAVPELIWNERVSWVTRLAAPDAAVTESITVRAAGGDADADW